MKVILVNRPINRSITYFIFCTANVYRQTTDQKCHFYTKIRVKSSKDEKFKNDRQMFAFFAAK